MVFRTVYIKKTKSDRKKGHGNYSFDLILNIDEEKADMFNVLVYAAEAFNDKHYFGIATISREENDKIIMQIKDFPERKEKLLLRDMKKFSYRLLEMTGILYFFKIE